MLTISCGAALHHARIALAAAGFTAEVARLPEEGDPDLLARIRLVGAQAPDRATLRLRWAIAERHADRRPFPGYVEFTDPRYPSVTDSEVNIRRATVLPLNECCNCHTTAALP